MPAAAISTFISDVETWSKVFAVFGVVAFTYLVARYGVKWVWDHAVSTVRTAWGYEGALHLRIQKLEYDLAMLKNQMITPAPSTGTPSNSGPRSPPVTPTGVTGL